MKNKKTLLIILLVVLLISVGSIVLINNTELLVNLEANAVSLIKQYLKVIGFLSIMGLVYLRMKKGNETTSEEVE
ncbi:hypothetical protein [Marinifilum flexuosum]|uniref:Uncharacterized protein n=1 Tax=Marinifilum flexuosum TaxID=1117708 RepID=A0A419XAL9_9BACT|nr:hypothetical protein [Marinifilum flexuosum]RKE04791.1 hypothetical protein BXY64_1819 [Marinifilum flexuosum]